jgi:hypothetical protein
LDRTSELNKLLTYLEKDNEVNVTEIEKECCGMTYMIDCPGIRFSIKPDVVELTFLNLDHIIVSYAEFSAAEKAIEFINYCKTI